jgi:hypothetical protein
MSLQRYGPQVEFDHCISREQAERTAASLATDVSAIGAHMIMANAYARRASALAEQYGLSLAQDDLLIQSVA